MFIRKFLEPQKVDEVNASGRFIKVMNSEGEFRIRATNNNGDLILDTDARAGFDVQVNVAFDKLTITSSTEQKLELWVSQHKLSYDALSTKASRSSSFVIEHYGDSQVLLPYDPAQAAVTIFSDAECWVGGEGVDIESGIRLPPQLAYKHESAAPLSVFINKPKTLKLLAGSPSVIDTGLQSVGSQTIRKINNELAWIDKGVLKLSSGDFEAYINSQSFGQIVGQPMQIGGRYYAIVNAKSGEITLAEIRIGDGFHLSKRVIVLNEPFSPRCVTCDGDRIYIAGVVNSGYGRAKIYAVKIGGDVVDYDTGVMPATANLSTAAIFYDSVGGYFWYSAKNQLWRSTHLMNDFEWVANMPSDLLNIEPLFSDDLIVFYYGTTQYCTPLVIDRVAGVARALSPSPKSVFYDGQTMLILASDGLYQSVDKGISSVRELEFTNNQGVGITNAAIATDDGLYIFAKNDGRAILKMKMGIDTGSPKAKFRVFKESF